MKTLNTLENLTEFESAFVDWIKTYHTGKETSVMSRDMRQWGKGPQIRRLIHDLRVKGVPICSTNQGYFYARTESEVESAVAFLTSYMNEIAIARQGLLRSYSNVANRLPL